MKLDVDQHRCLCSFQGLRIFSFDSLYIKVATKVPLLNTARLRLLLLFHVCFCLAVVGRLDAKYKHS